MATVSVNGRKYFFCRVTAVRYSGISYHVDTFHGAYTIDGGRKAGGTSRDWFVVGEHIQPYIACTSVIDALRLLDSM